MKVKKIAVSVIFVLFLIALFPMISVALGDGYIASLQKVMGEVQIERDYEYVKIEIGMMLYGDDVIETGWDSGAVIYFSEFQRTKEIDERESVDVRDLYEEIKKEIKEERLRNNIEELKEDIKGENSDEDRNISTKEDKARTRRKKIFKRKPLNFNR